METCLGCGCAPCMWYVTSFEDMDPDDNWL